MANLTNEQKGNIYDECIRQSDFLQRENSKLKSEYPINVPNDVQQIINENNKKIEALVGRLNSLFD